MNVGGVLTVERRQPLARSATRYRHEAAPNGVLVEVAERLFWLRLPLPLALDHVNVWLFDEDDGWSIIDCGYGDAATRAVWNDLFENELAGRPVRRIIATHFHPDHSGQFGWLTHKTGAEAWSSRLEWTTARMLALDDSSGFDDAGEAFDRLAGLEPELRAKRRARGNRFRKVVSLPPPVIRVLDAGDRLALGGSLWEVLIGEGHSPQMLTLHCVERGILIAGDQLLPRISPVIGVSPMMPFSDPLGDFLRSIEQYRGLPGETLVLPSHDAPYEGLHARIDQLSAHHEDRLARLLEACAEPTTAASLMRRLFTRRLDLHQLGFALGETLAHLNRLQAQGLLVSEPQGEGGALLWRRSR